MTNQKKSVEELLLDLHELEKRSKQKTRVLHSENGVFLLDKSNRHDVEWYENDENYDVI
ncbi:hypothetical protein K7887_21920 (plasmid) [Sutcliffiella horikoshii]|uniref:hypothetical protein n=1 Tax=Sutcliffiella horikoshii TaxID=79883 RepID=UPI001CBD6610|nr:hypothetical protein [Sutcliffiella horikoshii]UAL49724.1 hypothetical protein K7887_21920 [Sutcliffiella horikoshii]